MENGFRIPAAEGPTAELKQTEFIAAKESFNVS